MNQKSVHFCTSKYTCLSTCHPCVEGSTTSSWTYTTTTELTNSSKNANTTEPVDPTYTTNPTIAVTTEAPDLCEDRKDCVLLREINVCSFPLTAQLCPEYCGLCLNGSLTDNGLFVCFGFFRCYLFVLLFVCLFCWLFVCLFGCLFVCLFVWLVGWLFLCLVGWLVGCFFVWLFVCLVGCLIGWLFNCLVVGWLLVCFHHQKSELCQIGSNLSA